MALRIRTNGDVVCAALLPELPGDIYLDDAAHYRISVVCRALQADSAGQWHFVEHGTRLFSNDAPDHNSVVP